MKSNQEILKELNKKEIENNFYNIKVDSIPLWRLVRFNCRIAYLNNKTGFTNKSVASKLNKFELVKYFIISFFQLIKFYFTGNSHKNLVFAFPRLFKVGEMYIDKFTDPVIQNSNLKEDYIVFQHSFANRHETPRYNNSKIIYADFIDIICKILSKIYARLILRKYAKEINNLHKKITNVYGDNSINKLGIAINLASFKIYLLFYNLLFNKIKPKNVFVVNREVFKFILYLGKKYNVKTFEFQHGITQTETPLYTGIYQQKIDPDFLLVFGEAWINDFYGMPKDKIINIGWAYQDYVKINLNQQQKKEHQILVISSPAITQKIINFLIQALIFDKNLAFDIRLHPQEKLSESQINLIKKYKQIRVISNDEDSIFSITKYSTIIGDNSSVLYESLSMGKSVGKINMQHIFSRNVEDDLKNGFFIINSFADIIKGSKISATNSNEYYYSKFKKDIFNKIIK